MCCRALGALLKCLSSHLAKGLETLSFDILQAQQEDAMNNNHSAQSDSRSYRPKKNADTILSLPRDCLCASYPHVSHDMAAMAATQLPAVSLYMGNRETGGHGVLMV